MVTMHLPVSSLSCSVAMGFHDLTALQPWYKQHQRHHMKLNWCFQELILGLPGAAYQRQIGRDDVYLFRELLPLPRAHRPRQLQTNTHSHQVSCSFNIDSCTLPSLWYTTQLLTTSTELHPPLFNMLSPSITISHTSLSLSPSIISLSLSRTLTLSVPGSVPVSLDDRFQRHEFTRGTKTWCHYSVSILPVL